MPPLASATWLRATASVSTHSGSVSRNYAAWEDLLAEAGRHADARFASLLADIVDTVTLAEARRLADLWRVPVQEVLVATGALDATVAAAAVAASLHVACASTGIEIPPATDLPVPLAPRGAAHRAHWHGRKVRAFVAEDATVHDLAGAVAAATRAGENAVIVPRRSLEAAIEQATRRAGLAAARDALATITPELSAAQTVRPWQGLAIAIACGLFAGAFAVLPEVTAALMLAVMTLPFLAIVLLRTAALRELFRRGNTVSATAAPVADGDLPVYSVLVPLFDEAAVLPALLTALGRLDYPAAKLDILLVLEAADLATQTALLRLRLPPTLRVIVVPDGDPRTKPKALNYALRLARGSFVVVYDAEDRPAPDQLRRAIAAFAQGSEQLACMQARLNIYNPHQSWFTTQFTIEYSALFDAILPALGSLGLPVPLGGTSNHFPRQRLEAAGGWDPYNVTEDADLGIRLARLGLEVAVLESTTWEEAPARLAPWMRQRTRWLKGWMQTYLVHTRRPLTLLHELGRLRCAGFHLFMGGLILSALVHPLFYLLLAIETVAPHTLAMSDVFASGLLWWIAWANLVLGYASAIAVGAVAGRRRHGIGLAALAMPLYWLAISAAAYRALWQLWRDPFLWEKTAHGARRRR